MKNLTPNWIKLCRIHTHTSTKARVGKSSNQLSPGQTKARICKTSF